jgi:hypothetical protein
VRWEVTRGGRSRKQANRHRTIGQRVHGADVEQQLDKKASESDGSDEAGQDANAC